MVEIESAPILQMKLGDLRVFHYKTFLHDNHSFSGSERDIVFRYAGLKLLMPCFLQEQNVEILSDDVVLHIVDLGLPLQIVLLVPFTEIFYVPLHIVATHVGPVYLPVESCDESLVHHPIKASQKVYRVLGRCQVTYQVLILFKVRIPNDFVLSPIEEPAPYHPCRWFI